MSTQEASATLDPPFLYPGDRRYSNPMSRASERRPAPFADRWRFLRSWGDVLATAVSAKPQAIYLIACALADAPQGALTFKEIVASIASNTSHRKEPSFSGSNVSHVLSRCQSFMMLPSRGRSTPRWYQSHCDLLLPPNTVSVSGPANTTGNDGAESIDTPPLPAQVPSVSPLATEPVVSTPSPSRGTKRGREDISEIQNADPRQEGMIVTDFSTFSNALAPSNVHMGRQSSSRLEGDEKKPRRRKKRKVLSECQTTVLDPYASSAGKSLSPSSQHDGVEGTSEKSSHKLCSTSSSRGTPLSDRLQPSQLLSGESHLQRHTPSMGIAVGSSLPESSGDGRSLLNAVSGPFIEGLVPYPAYEAPPLSAELTATISETAVSYPQLHSESQPYAYHPPLHWETRPRSYQPPQGTTLTQSQYMARIQPSKIDTHPSPYLQSYSPTFSSSGMIQLPTLTWPLPCVNPDPTRQISGHSPPVTGTEVRETDDRPDASSGQTVPIVNIDTSNPSTEGLDQDLSQLLYNPSLDFITATYDDIGSNQQLSGSKIRGLDPSPPQTSVQDGGSPVSNSYSSSIGFTGEPESLTVTPPMTTHQPISNPADTSSGTREIYDAYPSQGEKEIDYLLVNELACNQQIPGSKIHDLDPSPPQTSVQDGGSPVFSSMGFVGEPESLIVTPSMTTHQPMSNPADTSGGTREIYEAYPSQGEKEIDYLLLAYSDDPYSYCDSTEFQRQLEEAGLI